MRMYAIDVVELEQAQDFSTRLMPTLSYLSQRNQSDPEIIRHQNLVGKLGEFAVRRMLTNNGTACSPVNLEVTTHKSWDADLMIAGRVRVHVKSQELEQAQRFGLSWTFGIGDKNGNKHGHQDKEIFKDFTAADMVVFCLVCDEWIGVCAQLPVHKLHALNLFHDPLKKSLVGIKNVVYYSDIPFEYRVY